MGVLGTLLSVCWFTLQLPVLSDGSAPLIAHTNATQATLTTASTLEGFFQGITMPLFYELAAELLFPLREGMSASLLVLLWNASAAVLILLNGYIPSADINLVMAATLAVVLLVIGACVKEEYRRPLNQGSRRPGKGLATDEVRLAPDVHVAAAADVLVVNDSGSATRHGRE